MSNILIIKHGSLGDIAQASGAIQDIFDHHKNDQLYLLTTKPYIDLFKKNPFIAGVILDKRLCEKNSDYGEKFIKLSRNIHFLNDDRAKIKLNINNHTGSKIKEIKEYTNY